MATFVWDLSQVWQCLINDQIMRFSTFRRSANFKSEGDANPPPEIFKIETVGIDGIVWRIWDIWHSRGQKRLNVSWGPLLRWSNTTERACQKTEWHGFGSKYRTWRGTWCPRHSTELLIWWMGREGVLPASGKNTVHRWPLGTRSMCCHGKH